MTPQVSRPEVQAYLRRQLQQYNAAYMDNWKDYSLHVEENGEILGGIVAESVGDTLEVQFLFVTEAARGQGLGSALLAEAEARAASDGLKRVLLNTYSFQAPGFYEKAGYRRLFAITPCFHTCSQHFFVKELSAEKGEG